VEERQMNLALIVQESTPPHSVSETPIGVDIFVLGIKVSWLLSRMVKYHFPSRREFLYCRRERANAA
jgi:hypothetical protein